MTEAEWLACSDPERMLVRLQTMGCLESNRKVCLLVYACSRRVWAWLDEEHQRDLEAYAAYADGLIADQPDGTPRTTRTTSCVPDLCVPLTYCEDVAEYASAKADGPANRATTRLEARVGQAALIRDIFGNPFHPSPELSAAVLGWGDRTVPRLAEGIYREGAFGRLPILADALLDAGCEDEELTQHCRSEGPHSRGCWAVDLILGRS
jgi:hypothetical protein